jgi:outer membrane biosynthesis protein TonB
MTSTFRWLGLALLGILIAAAISIAASRLASQQIGLASQPISAGDALAPAGQVGERPPRPPHPQTGRGHELPAPAEPVSPEPVEPATPTSPEPATPTSPEPATPTSPEPAPAPAHGDESGGSGGGRAGGGDD